MKQSLTVNCPNLPDDKSEILVELDNGVITGAVYSAKPWKNKEDLQKSFSPHGVSIVEQCGITSCYIKQEFSRPIINWISLEGIK